MRFRFSADFTHCLPSSIGQLAVLAVAASIGCSGGPRRIQPPAIDPETAAAEAVELYDTNGDSLLDQQELVRCPGLLSNLGAYDLDGSGTLSTEEIAERLAARGSKRVGLLSMQAEVRLNGRPLPGADITFLPEPYLGEEIQKAHGKTTSGGSAFMAIPDEQLPEPQRGLNAIHVGTYKVLVSHPEIELPPQYSSETDTPLGFETESGQSIVRFDLSNKN